MLQILLLSLFPAAMAFAASSDLITMTISNRLQLVLAAGFFVAAILAGLDATTIAWHVAAGALALVVGFALFAFDWIGGGDAKLVAVTALWFGFGSALIDYLLLSTMLGGLLTILLLYARGQPMPEFILRESWAARLLDHQTGIPYGIALAAGALCIYPQTMWMRIAIG